MFVCYSSLWCFVVYVIIIFSALFRSGSGQQEPVAMEVVFLQWPVLVCSRVYWLVVSLWYCLNVSQKIKLIWGIVHVWIGYLGTQCLITWLSALVLVMIDLPVLVICKMSLQLPDAYSTRSVQRWTQQSIVSLQRRQRVRPTSSPHRLAFTHVTFSVFTLWCSRSPPGFPGGRRRMGRINHGAGPTPPPMGGGGWGRLVRAT